LGHVEKPMETLDGSRDEGAEIVEGAEEEGPAAMRSKRDKRKLAPTTQGFLQASLAAATTTAPAAFSVRPRRAGWFAGRGRGRAIPVINVMPGG